MVGEMRVLVFGDSITQGFWDVEGGWVSRIRRAYDQKAIETDGYDQPAIFNMGVSGDSSDDVLARFNNETKVRANDELAFVFAIGVNDARTKAGINYSDTNRYKQNLVEILKAANKHSNKVLFVGLTPCVQERSNPVSWGDSGYTNGRIKEFDDTLRQFCEDVQVPYVEVFEPFSKAETESELLPDSLHPNDEGHQLIADLVMPKLQNLLRSEDQ
ncbi:MAG TPA: GDSL-type esterase/lipase family protein [Candidatus Saccharibacteria bacterium]|nr:GDSL-type esterase/lipase family protein [Candidatus Saccharibacteria bacterium]